MLLQYKNHAYFHQVVLLILVLLVASLQQLFKLSAQLQVIVFIALTLTIGMFHGMLDIVIFTQPIFKWPLFKKPLLRKPFFNTLLYLLAYVIAVLILIVVLLRVEVLVLPLLLILSVLHFGEPQRFDQSANRLLQRNLQRYVLGANSLAAPFFFQGSSLYAIVNGLINNGFHQSVETSQLAWLIWSIIALAWLPAALTLIGLRLVNQTHQVNISATVLESCIVWLAFALLPIWLAFALYFAGYHAIRHIRDVLLAASCAKYGLPAHLFSIVWVALVTILLMLVVLMQVSGQVFGQFSSQVFNLLLTVDINQWLRMLVILLTAVTLPHSILVYFWRKNNLLKPHKSL